VTSAHPVQAERTPARPRLLVVPHIYASDIVVREIELARRMTNAFDVFILAWRDPQHIDDGSVIRRRARQAATVLAAAFNRNSIQPMSPNVSLIQVPTWQPLLLQKILGNRAASALCTWRNHRMLRKIVQKLGITHLLLANDNFGVQRIPGVRIFFDIVDWFPEESCSPRLLAQVRNKIAAHSRQVDSMFAVSDPLRDKLLQDCNVATVALPNGADIQALRAVPAARVQALRAKLGLQDKFVFGYIGNHGSFTGVDLAVNAFLAVRQQMPDAVLLIVGPSALWASLLHANRNSGVVATGPVPPDEVADYFRAIDVGILAQGKTTGTDFAFQIKMVEYSACRKIVVCTPLLTWQRLAWPNVILAQPSVAEWAEALLRARSMSWDPAWDSVIEEFDWQVLANRAAAVMLAAEPGH
jgi:glycosyltransferase involved in cell wall biosynthesis